MINKEKLKKDLKLYLVTDSEILKDRDFYKCIEDAIKSGVTMVQLREKNADGKEFLEKAIKLRKLTNKYNEYMKSLQTSLDVVVANRSELKPPEEPDMENHAANASEVDLIGSSSDDNDDYEDYTVQVDID